MLILSALIFLYSYIFYYDLTVSQLKIIDTDNNTTYNRDIERCHNLVSLIKQKINKKVEER